MTELGVKDQLGRELILDGHPVRIVSLVPSLTELICDLSLNTGLVGVTKFCRHPKNIRKQAEVVGGTKKVHLEKIKLLRPDIILCNKEENTSEMVEALAKIAPVHVSDISTIDHSLELIEQYGLIFDRKKQTASLIERIRTQQYEFSRFIESKSKLKVAYFIWKDPWMVAGGDTFIDQLLRENNYENVFAHRVRYPSVSLEELENLAPDLIFLSTEPYPFKAIHSSEFNKAGIKGRVVLVDGEFFSWFGSRLEKAFAYFTLLRDQLDQYL